MDQWESFAGGWFISAQSKVSISGFIDGSNYRHELVNAFYVSTGDLVVTQTGYTTVTGINYYQYSGPYIEYTLSGSSQYPITIGPYSQDLHFMGFDNIYSGGALMTSGQLAAQSLTTFQYAATPVSETGGLLVIYQHPDQKDMLWQMSYSDYISHDQGRTIPILLSTVKRPRYPMMVVQIYTTTNEPFLVDGLLVSGDI